MMNSGITNLTNPYLWQSFGPYAWMSNYGFETQMNILPNIMPPFMAELAHGMLNPEHVSQWNPMFSVPTQSYTTNPMLTQQGLDAAAEYGRNLAAQALDGMTFSQTAQRLSSIKGQTSALMEDENISEAQKQKLKEVKEKAEAIQKELNEYKKEMQKSGSDKTALREKLAKISKSAEAIEKEYVELVKQIKEELEKAEETAKEDTAAEEEEKVDGNEDSNKPEAAGDAEEGAQSAENAEGSLQPQSVNGADGKTNGQERVQYSAKYEQSQYVTSDAAKTNGKNIAQDLFDAINYTWGTDEKKLDKAMESINKDNVMEVLDAWNKTHAKEFDGESLLESIYGDIFWGKEREEYTRKLMDSLAAKAKEAGVDISAEYSELNEELKSWWRDDEKIYELISTIHKNLGGYQYKAA